MAFETRRVVFHRMFLNTQEGNFVAARMMVLRGKETVSIVDVALAERRALRLLKQVGIRENEAEKPLAMAVIRFGVRRIEEAIRQAVELPHTHFITIEDDDLPLLAELITANSCDYQQRDGRELYCSVAGEQHAVAIGLRRLFPTSTALCNACTLPATDYLCSHLHHPVVGGVTRYQQERPDGQGGFIRTGPYILREVTSALCDLGRPEIAHPDSCRPGGNSCWERAVEPEIEEPPAPPAALGVAEALDHLALAWEVAFGRPLFRTRSIVVDAALAVVECGRMSDLKSLLSQLADVLNAIVIEDDLLPGGGAPIQKSHSLARLLAALKKEVPAEAHLDMDRAVVMLQAIVAVRTGYQHQERRGDLADAFGKLRLHWPPDSPQQTWDGIRARTIEAAAIIRDAVRQLAPYRDRV